MSADGPAEPTQEPALNFDSAVRAQSADDIGHLVHHLPTAVVPPQNADDVARTLRWAGRTGSRVAPQGRRHSVWGHCQADGGVVVDMTALRAVHSVHGDRVVVDAGATWSDVLAVTLPQGLTPPVLTDYLELSVGGTLIVGGVGGTTSTFGAQSDNVIEMDVVTGRAEQLTCSASRNAEVFNAIRAGLAQVGIITRATLKLIAAPQWVRRFLLYYPDLTTMLDEARLLLADNRFDAVQGAILPSPDENWTFRLDVTKYFAGIAPDDSRLLRGLHDHPAQRQPMTLTYLDYINRFAAVESALRDNGQWFHPHPWLMTFVGDSRVESVVGAELERLDPAIDLGQFGQILLSPMRRAPITSPLLRLPAENLFFLVGLVRIPDSADLGEANRLVERNRATYERIRDAGGTLYPVSALPMSHDDWRHHLGAAYQQLADAKHEHDPLGVLTPGYDLFP